jgi:hypothetical protein
MRFLVMVKANNEWDGELPTAEMGAFNETLMRDGVMLAAEGLQPSSKGARISYGARRPVVIDGPFTETKELVAGFWILQASSKDELIERFAHCPFARGESIEIRQIFEPEDFADSAIQARLQASRMKQLRTARRRACELHDLGDFDFDGVAHDAKARGRSNTDNPESLHPRDARRYRPLRAHFGIDLCTAFGCRLVR